MRAKSLNPKVLVELDIEVGLDLDAQQHGSLSEPTPTPRGTNTITALVIDIDINKLVGNLWPFYMRQRFVDLQPIAPHTRVGYLIIILNLIREPVWQENLAQNISKKTSIDS